MQIARSRRGLPLDLKRPEAQVVLHRLVPQADVVITSHPLPLRARLGQDWARLEPLSPRLIYASLTGYGETGPEAAKPGFDATTEGARGSIQSAGLGRVVHQPLLPRFEPADRLRHAVTFGVAGAPALAH